MWLITGPFDGEVVGDVSFQRTKLLKPNSKYPLGRKETRLLINNKKISGEHGAFEVGNFDVADATSVPTLTFECSKKSFKIKRDETTINFGMGMLAELRAGDEITLINGFVLKVQWNEICCYSSTSVHSPWKTGCASLGIHLVPTSCSEVTHHLTSDYAATASLATSLISSAQFVKPEWLQEILRLGSLSGDYDRNLGLALEESFSLPAVTKFRPSMPQSLDPTFKRSAVWEPNEERFHIFKDYRFLCVGEKAREIPLDLRKMLERGDGALQSFDAHLGVDKFRRALTRGRVKEKKLVLVGDEAVLSTALGEDVLREFVREARSCNLSFTSPDTLVQTVLGVDTSKLDPEEPNETGVSSLPDRIPNTYSEEPSIVDEPEEPPSRRLLRRAASRQSSAAPEPAPVEAPPFRPLRRPTRRHNQNSAMVTGLDDPSSVIDSLPDLDAPAATAPMGMDLTTPARPMRLKRRMRSAEPTNLESTEGTFEIQDSIREPPLKRFKALFEASDPDKLEQSSALVDSQVDTFATGSQTQTESQARTFSGSKAKSLSVLREEEEESVETNTSRKRQLDEDEDIAMEDSGESQNPPAKRRATSTSHVAATRRTPAPEVATQSKTRATSKPPSQAAPPPPPLKTKSKGGAEPGKPDTDLEFLKAIASTKKGKKKEDEFDREFNKLKISKPDLNDEEPEKEWALLAEFGDDSELRGNFMTVLEVEVFRERNGQTRARQDNPEWQGKPNFKKFKRKDTRSERPKIDLFVSTEDDIGIGSAYWKNGNSQDATEIRESPPKPRKRAPSKTLSPVLSEEEVEVITAPPPVKPHARSRVASLESKAPSRAGSVVPVPAKRANTRRAKPVIIEEEDEAEEDLFLGSDDDSIQLDGDDQDDEDTMRSGSTFESFDPCKPKAAPKKSKGSAAAKKTKKPVVRDDSDDDAVFKGFGRRRR